MSEEDVENGSDSEAEERRRRHRSAMAVMSGSIAPRDLSWTQAGARKQMAGMTRRQRIGIYCSIAFWVGVGIGVVVLIVSSAS